MVPSSPPPRILIVAAARKFLAAESEYLRDLHLRGTNAATNWPLFAKYINARIQLTNLINWPPANGPKQLPAKEQ